MYAYSVNSSRTSTLQYHISNSAANTTTNSNLNCTSISVPSSTTNNNSDDSNGADTDNTQHGTTQYTHNTLHHILSYFSRQRKNMIKL